MGYGGIGKESRLGLRKKISRNVGSSRVWEYARSLQFVMCIAGSSEERLLRAWFQREIAFDGLSC